MLAYDGDCASLRAYEGRVLWTFARAVTAWRQADVCAALSGFELTIHPHEVFRDSACGLDAWAEAAPDPKKRRCYYGRTSFGPHTIELAGVEWDRGALAHEIAHVADNMTGGVQHCRWSDRLFRAALSDLSTLNDPSSPEPDCPP